MLLRVVLMNVDVVKRGLLQTEDVDHGPMEDVVGLCKELVKAPALLLICLQDVGKNWCEEALEAPGTAKRRAMTHNALLPAEDTSTSEVRLTWTSCRRPASRCSTRSSHFQTSGVPRWFREVSP